jgi:hypothetical protein
MALYLGGGGSSEFKLQARRVRRPKSQKRWYGECRCVVGVTVVVDEWKERQREREERQKWMDRYSQPASQAAKRWDGCLSPIKLSAMPLHTTHRGAFGLDVSWPNRAPSPSFVTGQFLPAVVGPMPCQTRTGAWLLFYFFFGSPSLLSSSPCCCCYPLVTTCCSFSAAVAWLGRYFRLHIHYCFFFSVFPSSCPSTRPPVFLLCRLLHISWQIAASHSSRRSAPPVLHIVIPSRNASLPDHQTPVQLSPVSDTAENPFDHRRNNAGPSGGVPG